ncbi:MAG: phage GP46 family protein [Humidesulfovibrio sp.]|nr:phage GP46 family protein [Humidesulfovibrio sp.]
MADALLDSISGDYALAYGALVPDPARGLANAVYLRLKTPLGSYWADAALGSRLHELQREKDVARVAILAKAYCEQALQPLLDDGRALAFSVGTERLHDGRLGLAVRVTDAGGREHLFNHYTRVL